MANVFTPGLRVAYKTVIRKNRILPLKGEVIKKVGDSVKRDEIVARTALPGAVTTANVVNRLGIMANEIDDFMLKKPGEAVIKDEPIAETKSFIKWFKTSVPSPISGSIESVSSVTGQVLLRAKPLPVEVYGYLNGKVIEVVPEEGIVVESAATFIQGIMGIGGEVWGELKIAVDSSEQVLTQDMLTADMKDCIVVGGSFADYKTIQKAIQLGIKGLIVGGIHDGDLRQILGYDLGVAITGAEKVGITLLLTEGFGEIAISERAFKNLKKREGDVASISGATQIRAGVIRPEIIIPFDNEDTSAMSVEDEEKSVSIGDYIRVIRQPYFGKIGKIHALPPELRKIESETKARTMEIKFEDGEIATIPRANVEAIKE